MTSLIALAQARHQQTAADLEAAEAELIAAMQVIEPDFAGSVESMQDRRWEEPTRRPTAALGARPGLRRLQEGTASGGQDPARGHSRTGTPGSDTSPETGSAPEEAGEEDHPRRPCTRELGRGRREGRMNFDLAVIAVTERGVQVALDGDNSPAFWLPRQQVQWHGALEPGGMVHATIPRWLAAKHRQLVAVRGQYSIPLNPLPGLDPEKAKEPFPMAYDNNMTGALFKNRKRETDKHPLYTGSCEINGQKLWISAWLKQSKNGETYMSLAFKPAEEQQQRQQSEPPNSYAAAKQGRAGGPDFGGSNIPFAPEVR